MYSRIVVSVFLATGHLAFPCLGEPKTVDDPRLQRSVFTTATQNIMEGYKATAQLLKGAYPLFTNTKKTPSYWKSGDFATAIADFESVSPGHVRDLMLGGAVGKKGIAGDRIISVEHIPKTGWTTLTITKNAWTKKETTKEIVYVHALTPVNTMPKF